MKPGDLRIIGVSLRFLPVETRVPLKFGTETLRSVTCARVEVRVRSRDGREESGHGETPLSVQWVWPSERSYDERFRALSAFAEKLVDAWASWPAEGHALEIGHAFLEQRLPALREAFNAERAPAEPLPLLAALVACSAFDIAVHDACGKIHGLPVYSTYTGEYLNRDLAAYLEPAAGADVSFEGKFPADYLLGFRPDRLPAWHLVGGMDLLEESDRRGDEPEDGYPVLLRDWIERDGLRCLKVKLRGNDAVWDMDRLVHVGRIAVEKDVPWLTADFNCTVSEPAYVNDILDRLVDEHPAIYGKILYVEQPFPYDLEAHRIDVHSVSARKPLFMDESAHDWRFVRLGRELGWTGVALKTCKTQTGALLSLAWAKAHGMTLMVQDLTNPMLAQIPHVLLGAWAGTIQGVETNGMQFYPDASAPEERVHPGIYRRRDGLLDLSTIRGPGFGYRIDEIERDLPGPVRVAGALQ